MFKKLLNKKLLKNQKGLTLIELLAVIVILAIVAAIAIPAIGNIINNSRDKAILSEASNILSGAKIAVTDNACQATANTCSNTELDPYFDGTLTSGDSVTWKDGANGEKTYTIIYSKFSNIKNTTKYEITNKTLTEANLLELLGK